VTLQALVELRQTASEEAVDTALSSDLKSETSVAL